MLGSYSKYKRQRRKSQEILDKAVQSGRPFTYLRTHVEEWELVFIDDFMWLVRVSEDVELTSGEIADILEDHREWSGFAATVARRIRDKLAKAENGSKP